MSLSNHTSEINFRSANRCRSWLNRILFSLIHFISALSGRFIEFISSFLVLVCFTFPAYILLLLRRAFTGKSAFKTVEVFGKYGKKLKIKYFNVRFYLIRNLPLFYYVIIGKFALVGLSLRTYKKENRVLRDAYLFNNKPGIFNLWFIRESSRMNSAGKIETELQYLSKKSLLTDFILILKSIPAAFYHSEQNDFPDIIDMLDISFKNIEMGEAIKLIKNTIKKNLKKKICFVNPDCMNKIFSDKEYHKILRDEIDYIFPDGIGINIACNIIKTPLKENINGTDMLPYICESAVENKYSIYLLGGKPGIAATMKQRLEDKYPKLKIVGENHGYFDKTETNSNIIDNINRVKPNIVLVAFGVPIQEKWFVQNIEKLNCNIIMGVGGLFDFYSGNIKRAPVWMREMGLEWIFRLMQEPGRMWRRYIIGNPLFIYRVLKWKFCTFGAEQE